VVVVVVVVGVARMCALHEEDIVDVDIYAMMVMWREVMVVKKMVMMTTMVMKMREMSYRCR